MSLDIANILKGELKDKNGVVLSEDVMSKRVVAVYFSAHWCPPCRNFTPMLKNFYNQLKEMGASFEIVFVSSDQDDNKFNEYYSTMPWLAVPFGDDRIKKLKTAAQIQGIPTLIFVDPSNGKILHGNDDGTEIVYNGNIETVIDWCM